LTLVCPNGSGNEARLAGPELSLIAPKNLQEIVGFAKGTHIIEDNFECETEDENYQFDMSDVSGQEIAKRALEIAAAGKFHVLLIGPPGVGKSMLAKRMITIMPPLTPRECVEVTMIYSIANKLSKGKLKIGRPYRDPHHSSSLPALVGGGATANPGEISLAHNGILFLDELGEFSKALEGLRESMESGTITIARANNHVTYPAKTQVIAAMNPCRCGNFGTIQGCKKQSCAQNYQARISRPILDRFDLVVYLDNSENFYTEKSNEKSSEIRNRVKNSVKFHQENFTKQLEEMTIEDMSITKDAINLLTQFCQKNETNRRGFLKIAKIARVIANLSGNLTVQKWHLAEALAYRYRNR